MNNELDVVILAAGKGTRMRSRHPKVLHLLAGKPMLDHVLDTAEALDPTRIQVVVGHGADQLRDALSQRELSLATQTEQKGTGHAVMQAQAGLGNGKVLILYGDVPLIQAQCLAALLDQVNEQQMGLLTITLPDPTGYGRLLRDDQGQAVAIVEQKDASAAELGIHECNTGIMAMSAAQLERWLPRLDDRNAQGEYYLTDVIALAAAEGIRIATVQPAESGDVEGVNNRAQLARLERLYQARLAQALMEKGVALADPARLDVRGTLDCGQDVFIDVGCVFEGEVVLEDGVSIGPHCVIRESRLGAGSQVEAHCVLENAVTAGDNRIGPFARLRPGTRLGEAARVGNFVETKNAEVGAGSKINHLSYVGDARLGKGVNVGAGTITCNYDGTHKHHTEIGDHAFIGSNSALIAPVTIGRHAVVGAGSALTRDLADHALAVTRGRLVEKRGYRPDPDDPPSR